HKYNIYFFAIQFLATQAIPTPTPVARMKRVSTALSIFFFRCEPSVEVPHFVGIDLSNAYISETFLYLSRQPVSYSVHSYFTLLKLLLRSMKQLIGKTFSFSNSVIVSKYFRCQQAICFIKVRRR